MESIPALVWNRDILLTTFEDVWVRTVGSPPYGEMGKACVVPFSVLTTTHRLSREKAMS